MLRWLRGDRSGSSGAMGAAMNALQDVFDPGAARARELTQADHELALPAPTPGDELLKSGVVRLRRSL